jgi:hypothetical protein
MKLLNCELSNWIYYNNNIYRKSIAPKQDINTIQVGFFYRRSNDRYIFNIEAYENYEQTSLYFNSIVEFFDSQFTDKEYMYVGKYGFPTFSRKKALKLKSNVDLHIAKFEKMKAFI